MTPHRIWIKQCEPGRGIEDDFDTQKALAYLIIERFINVLQAADGDAEFRAEFPAFIAEIKSFPGTEMARDISSPASSVLSRLT
jgi:hypothetical protein